jgi:hypothetical protein
VIEPPCSFRAVFHWPTFYRYRVGLRGLRVTPNRYGHAVIGLALVAGRYAYCVKWADARAVFR